MHFINRLNEALSSRLGMPAPSPVRERPQPGTRPHAPPAKPGPGQKPNPFWPDKKPAKEPKPKAVLFMEAYEEEVNPGTQTFWDGIRDNEHRFSKFKHPILVPHGGQLSRGSHKFTTDRLKKTGLDMRQIMSIYNQILKHESAHKEQLQGLAIKVTAEIWNIPEDQLRGMLTDDMELSSDDDDNGEPAELPEPSPEQVKEINKRVTFNTITHGSAVHNMMTMHHMVRDEINKIDPGLLKLYDQIAAGSHSMYWMWDIAAMAAQLSSMAAGSTKVDWSGDKPVVQARAICFPVLCQELSKGVTELISQHHTTSLDPETQAVVLHHADRLEDEPWLIQVGPELWRRFLKAVNHKKGLPSLAEVLTALATQPPDDVHKIVALAVTKPEEASELLHELTVEKNEFDVDEYGGGDEDDLQSV